MAYLRGFGVVRQDPDWLRKVGVLSVAAFSTLVIPLAGHIIVQGWYALLLRQVVKGEEGNLPRIDFDFQYLGKLLAAGFKPFLVSLLWALPVAGVAGIGFAVGIPIFIATALSTGDDGAWMAGVCFLIGFLLLIPVLVVMQLPAAVAGLKAELADDVSAGLRLNEVLAFTRANLGVLFRGALVFAGVGTVLGAVGIMLCYVGVFPVAIMMGSAWHVFLADVYRRHVEQGGIPFEIRPIDAES